MERVDAGQPFGVIVDFAHSPASLPTVLDLLAPAAAARGGGLIAVFGSAGERDTAKRPQMGRIAGERARLVVVTDEDPRGEDREAILDEIARGAEAAGKRRGQDLQLIADRRAAIETAFEAARPGDIVLLAGKGHERSIIGPDGEQPGTNGRGPGAAGRTRVPGLTRDDCTIGTTGTRCYPCGPWPPPHLDRSRPRTKAQHANRPEHRPSSSRSLPPPSDAASRPTTRPGPVPHQGRR